MKFSGVLLLTLLILSTGLVLQSQAQCFNPLTIYGETQSDFFGEVVVGGSDLSGDGIPDIIVGAPQYDNGEIDEGRAEIWLAADTAHFRCNCWTTWLRRAALVDTQP